MKNEMLASHVPLRLWVLVVYGLLMAGSYACIFSCPPSMVGTPEMARSTIALLLILSVGIPSVEVLRRLPEFGQGSMPQKTIRALSFIGIAVALSAVYIALSVLIKSGIVISMLDGFALGVVVMAAGIIYVTYRLID